MTLYLVKHDRNDYRLHESDGTETGNSWSWDEWLPTDESKRVSHVESVEQAAGGSNWVYRDMTLDDESVPWR